MRGRNLGIVKQLRVRRGTSRSVCKLDDDGRLKAPKVETG